ncbi:hypothetical protein, partial [Stieleria sp.]|uniref:hypothetical protein n=1 Tax=Stieleria sp. TaxID=2795976 RepID=UPI003565E40E
MPDDAGMHSMPYAIWHAQHALRRFAQVSFLKCLASVSPVQDAEQEIENGKLNTSNCKFAFFIFHFSFFIFHFSFFIFHFSFFIF